MEHWLKAAVDGDSAAMEAVYRRFSPAVQRLAAGLLNDTQDAEEVTQDAFTYAFRNLRRYDPAKAAFQTWLFTIAISRCRNKRRRKWLDTVPLAWLTGNAGRPERTGARQVEDWLVARGVRLELWRAVQALTPNLREALILRFVGGLAYAEIGKAVNCGEKAAESRVRTALASLRKQMASEAGASADWLNALSNTEQPASLHEM